MAFKIFENVDLVKARRFGAGPRGPRESIYPVAELKVGQAFFAPLEDKDEEGNYIHVTEIKDEAGNDTGEYRLMTIAELTRKIQGSVSRLAKSLDVKLAVRSLPASDDGDVNPWSDAGVGVWRQPGKYGQDKTQKKAA